jgi:pimeloyl-ACP methyl ester carboxylesterase
MRTLVALFVVVSVAGMVGCAPAEPPAVAEPPDTGLENGSFTTDLNGFAIHYEVHGRGPTLMVLPQSWGLSIEGLRELYKPLEEKLSLVYFDPRGIGGSAAIADESDMGMAAVRADFDALRRHLGLDPVNAIGWSNGAMNLILLAAEHPDTIANAIFVHGVASFTEEDNAEIASRYPELMQEYAQFLEDVRDPDLSDQQQTEMMRALWFEKWFPLSTADPESAPLMFERLFGSAQFSWPHADYADRESPTFDARDRLPLITARCLVIAGAYDMLSVGKVQELADGLDDAEFVVFESSGHFAPAEEPEAFANAVFTFLGVE